jgi:hypothetical protein
MAALSSTPPRYDEELSLMDEREREVKSRTGGGGVRGRTRLQDKKLATWK